MVQTATLCQVRGWQMLKHGKECFILSFIYILNFFVLLKTVSHESIFKLNFNLCSIKQLFYSYKSGNKIMYRHKVSFLHQKKGTAFCMIADNFIQMFKINC